MTDSAPQRSGAPTFESDFRDLRDARGLSLDDLNRETRIPVDVLRRFESGALLSDDSFSDVYVRAFVKSYAKALGVPQARALDGFDAHRAGRYAGQLRDDYTPPKAPPPPPVAEEDTPDDVPSTSRAKLPAPPPAPEAPRVPKPSAAPAIEALRTGGTAVPSAQSKPNVTATRVQRPVVPAARRSFDKNWGTLGILAFVLLAVCAAAVWFLVFRTDTGEDDLVAEGDSSAGEAMQPDSLEATGPTGPRLQTPITLTVEATDGGLQWFRITSDSDERSPNWIDEGTERVFTADSTLIVWGEGNASDTAYDFAEATLVLQGLRWRPANGAPVRISLQNGQALLDSLAGAGVTAAPAPEASGADAQTE